jgi:hypothetical protein
MIAKTAYNQVQSISSSSAAADTMEFVARNVPAATATIRANLKYVANLLCCHHNASPIQMLVPHPIVRF